MEAPFEIFLVAPPGFEPLLRDEAEAAGFPAPVAVPGGVSLRGGWPEVWRANLELRGAARVLVRIAAFRALHLAQLDRRARRIDWAALLPPGAAVKVEASSRGSRIWHAGAAAARVLGAVAAATGARPGRLEEGALRLLVRLDDDLCTLSLDSSGEPLHRRGIKLEVGPAPLRETLAALLLAACGWEGRTPVLDPLCGSGTIPIVAAEIALGLAPGRARAFAFERLAGFDAAAWAALRARPRLARSEARMGGADRDAGAIRRAAANARRAGVEARLDLRQGAISDLVPPPGPAGLVLTNPPWGVRIGERRPLMALHGALGAVLRARFAGWRVGIVTADEGLARATGLPFAPPGPPLSQGGIAVRLWQAGPLAAGGGGA
ncbi:MAG: class I SAM-dependent RNA methyltransferase [Rhodobacteraceae bacterium]|nr:class I SAM-dependent RNA methyltransferase [Paracoccaceae bacterium]